MNWTFVVTPGDVCVWGMLGVAFLWCFVMFSIVAWRTMQDTWRHR